VGEVMEGAMKSAAEALGLSSAESMTPETAPSEEEIVAKVAASIAADERSDVVTAVVEAVSEKYASWRRGDGAQVLVLNEEDLKGLKNHYFIETKGSSFRGIPKEWLPNNLSPRRQELLELWGKVVGMVLAGAGHKGASYDVGFLIDRPEADDTSRTKAQYFQNGEGTHVFLLNAMVHTKKEPLSLAASRRRELVMVLHSRACHEVAHYLREGSGWHNESFVSAEADLRETSFAQLEDLLALAGKPGAKGK
jgi:hypothetical protein